MFKTKFITIATISLVLAGAATLTQCGGKSEGDKADTTAASPDVEAGKTLYTSNGCAACHGANGLGDGPAGASLNPIPRDFSAKDTYKQGTSQAEIAQSIAAGVPGTPMAAYASIADADRMKIAAFLVSVQK